MVYFIAICNKNLLLSIPCLRLDRKGNNSQVYSPAEPAVQERVGACAAHGKEVDTEEGEVVEVPAGQGQLKVLASQPSLSFTR